MIPHEAKYCDPNEIDDGEVRVSVIRDDKLQDCSCGWQPSVPVFRAEGCLQLEQRIQPHGSLARPRAPVHHVCDDGLFSFCGQPHVMLIIAIRDGCKYRGSKEVDDTKERIPGMGRLMVTSILVE